MADTHPMNDRIPAARPRFSGPDIAAILPKIQGVLESGRLILGQHTTDFENAFSQYIGTGHAVAVNSCSSALQISLRYFGATGREVIVPANNFPGVVSTILYEGGVPVLAEMDPATFCLDTKDALRRITPRTAGIVVLHLAGLVHPDIDRLRDACRKKGLFLIEDAAHAAGAAIGGRKAGSLADAGCFSFYPTKLMTTGTGGMITTQDADLADYARLLRHHGQGNRRGEFLAPGNDWCMSEIHAILGLHQLAAVDASVEHRNRVVEWYRTDLADADWISIPGYPENLRHAYYKFPVLLDESVDRDTLRNTLEEEFGIENGTIYDPPCHLQPALRETLGYRPGAFPRSEEALARQLCLPIHLDISRDDVDRVTRTLRTIIDRCRVVPAGAK